METQKQKLPFEHYPFWDSIYKQSRLDQIFKVLNIIFHFFFIIIFILIIIFFILGKIYFVNNFTQDEKWAQQFLIENEDKTLDDFAGYPQLKNEMKKLVESSTNGDIINKNMEKGIILYGPPGTGKTFLCECLARELIKKTQNKIPFYSVSGSSFVEKYVGVGAARLRTLFNVAKKETQRRGSQVGFIFIDEIDVFGIKRSNDPENNKNIEHESTLTELLNILQGFKKEDSDSVKIVVIGATNRFEILDGALTRKGRLGKHFYFSNPDVETLKILIQNFAKKPEYKRIFSFLSEEELEKLAQMTHNWNFTPPKIYDLFKEAAILIESEKNNLKDDVYKKNIIWDAMEKVSLGPINREYNSIDDLRKVIVHELGHAFVSYTNGYEVHRISFNASGNVGGYTLATLKPKDKTELLTKKNLLNQIQNLLGSRIFEELYFGKDELTIGATDDLQKAYCIAQQMVTKLGMLFSSDSASKEIEWINTEQEQSNTKEKIQEILRNCYEIARNLIVKNISEDNFKKILNEKINILSELNKLQEKKENLKDSKIRRYLTREQFETIYKNLTNRS